jgi:5-(carboxyamino)imidazole ribonucleotide synthase
MGAVLGVIGGGQLARMMIPAALELGVEIKVLAESENSSARLAASAVGDYRDVATVVDFARGVDVITFDHEHVPASVLSSLEAEGIAFRPGPQALLCAQDKAVMRERLALLGVPVPAWALARSLSDIEEFLDAHSHHVVAKTTRGGYDGKGVRVIAHAGDVADWLDSGEVLLEEKVEFVTEVAQLVARRPSGEIAAWPLVETVQKHGVCSEVMAPAHVDKASEIQARSVAIQIAEGLGVTGVLAVEMFVLPDGSVLVNELAMRPHNSGHIFTELSYTSQFEQHVRAVLDWPLGDTSLLAAHGVMVNVFGGVKPDKVSSALNVDHRVKLHDYGKAPRPGRKAGHVSVVGSDREEIASLARTAVAAVAEDGLA